MSTGLGGQSESDGPSSSCGFSYSQFVRQCSECLTDRQLERVAMRLKAYKGLKKTPRAQNKLTVIRDIGKIVPQEHRDSLTKLLSDSLDIVDPHHFLRLSKVSAERICIMLNAHYSLILNLASLLFVSKMKLATAFRSRLWATIPEWRPFHPPILFTSYALSSQKRIGELVVDWQDPSIPTPGTRSKNLVFLSNLPHAPRNILTDVICKAFSGCGTIVNLEIFDDRLRTLDQTDDNTMQAKGEQAIKDKLERRFSPIFALAEFSSTQEKENACSTYLRTFGVPCIDRLVYPEDAAVKKTLIATNLPFVLTPDEIARILAFALVQDSENNRQKPGTCRIRMTNPGLFGYDQLLVEARSDAPEPFFVLPLHEKVPSVDAVPNVPGSETLNYGSSDTTLDCRFGTSKGKIDIADLDRVRFSDEREHKAKGISLCAGANDESYQWQNTVSVFTDENVFVPRALRPPMEEGIGDRQNFGSLFGLTTNNCDLGHHVVKK
ncbi:hypothetical protein cyc_05835 [Cyclospora cayetanensis]|uniref:Uncharacterized protein n=1 Tax=Cyclospora cayetanensis TaxID=88456 RepID=A0A1D3D0F6_9EIME|nr:hypothetical protein cyc_05835 [Cyclospora cayetanensis]